MRGQPIESLGITEKSQPGLNCSLSSPIARPAGREIELFAQATEHVVGAREEVVWKPKGYSAHFVKLGDRVWRPGNVKAGEIVCQLGRGPGAEDGNDAGLRTKPGQSNLRGAEARRSQRRKPARNARPAAAKTRPARSTG